MRWLASLFVMLPLCCLAQQKYIAGYEAKLSLDFSDANVELPKAASMKFDSSFSEELKKKLAQKINQPGFFENLIKQQIGEQVTIFVNVRADSTTAELEGHGGMQISIERNQRYENGRWLTLNKKKNIYEEDSSITDVQFYYTKNKKAVLGYTCYEMKSKDTLNLVTLWVCKDLPPTISPGIKFKTIDYAIFEYIDEANNTRIVLKSIRKLN